MFLQLLFMGSTVGPVRFDVRAAELRFAALSSTAQWVLTASGESESLQVWNGKTGKQVTELAHERLSRCGVAFGADDQLVLTGGWNDYKIWRPKEDESWSLEKRVPRNTGMLFSACAVAPDGTWIAITPDSRRVDLLAAPDWERLTSLTVPNPGVIRCIRISPDGRYVAIASENHTIQVWDLANLDHELQRLGARSLFPL